MGAFNMRKVMKSLAGVSLPIPWGTCEKATKNNKVGDPIMRDLDPYDLALLLTIAYRQHDPPCDKDGHELPSELDWFCFGSKEELMRISHVKKHKFYDCERYLLDSGLVTYKKRECYRDIFNLASNKKRWYTNVYRLNTAMLAECLVISSAIKAQAQSEDVPLEAEDVPQGESNVPKRDANVPQRNAQITTQENNVKDNNKSGAVVENDKSVKRYQEFIALHLGVEPEEIGLPSVRKYALGKSPKAIKEIATKIRASKSCNNKIGVLFRAIEKLPNLTPEQMEAQFSEVRKLPAEKIPKADQSIENGWKQLVADLGLDELDAAKMSEAKEKFEAMLKSHPDEEKDALEKLRDDLPGETGCADFAEMRSTLTPQERVNALIPKCEKMTF